MNNNEAIRCLQNKLNADALYYRQTGRKITDPYYKHNVTKYRLALLYAIKALRDTDNKADILYLCDTRITDCKRISCQTDCFLTHDIKHAKNFKHIKGANCFIENDDENRPQGKWIALENAYGEIKYKCSHCGHFLKSGTDKNFCPNCGAQMDKRGCNL